MIGTIEQLIDKSLNYFVAKKLNCLPEVPPKNMAIQEKAEDEDWYFWKPIVSTVTDKEIAELEKCISTVFPEQYKRILKHKHFLELCFGQVNLIAHPSFGWQACITDMIFAGDINKITLNLGYLPFAFYSDWGLWCFRLQERSAENECPVYLWDHDQPEHFEFVADNLENALIEEMRAA